MTNYNNGKIYKIEPICEHDEDEIYIGSTTKERLCQRMSAHKYQYKKWKEGLCNKISCFDMFDKYGINNLNIVLIELVDANSKDELLKREAHYIKALKCVNKKIPLRTPKEWQKENKDKVAQYQNKYDCKKKEKIREKKKLYYEANKDKITEYREQNKDQIRKVKKLYREQNKEKIDQLCKDYRERNKEKIQEKKRIYYEANKDKISEQQKQYYECNKDKISEQKKLYREKQNF